MDAKHLSVIKKEVERKIETASPEQILEIAEVLEIGGLENDWWKLLPDEQKHEIDAALDEADNGMVMEHDEVVKKFAPWLAK